MRSETDLIDHSLPQLATAVGLRNPSFTITQEVVAGNMIADVVILSGRRPSGPTPHHPLSIHEATILSLLRNYGPTRIDVLEEKAGLDNGDLRSGTLNRMEDWRLLVKGPGGRISANYSWVKGARVYAFEAKLHRWRQALLQAVEYTRFADRSYVLLASKHAKPALDNLDLFQSLGIGLLILQSSGMRLAATAKRKYDMDWRREYVLSRIWR